jgi:hypothetical protein
VKKTVMNDQSLPDDHVPCKVPDIPFTKLKECPSQAVSGIIKKPICVTVLTDLGLLVGDPAMELTFLYQ